VLIGGAGGYRPLDHTPEIWARVVAKVFDQKRVQADNKVSRLEKIVEGTSNNE
jgi:hypothetical protein